MRRCVGCMVSKPKQELIRLTGLPGGGIDIDESGKAQSRGVYLCPDPECFKKARKKRILTRNLGLPNISDEDYEILGQKLEKLYESRS